MIDSFLTSRVLQGLAVLCLSGLLAGSHFIRADDGQDQKSEQKQAVEKTPPDNLTAKQKDAEKPEQKWQSLFDEKSLDGWKETEFGTGGEVKVDKGQLILSFGDGCTGVTWQKEFPKVDYEVRLQAQRVEGTDFFCGMTFPVQESFCSLVVGGWSGAVVGLSAIDGELANDNPTTKFMTFKKGQWYDIRVRVTKTRITAWIDDKQVVDQETTGHEFSLHPAVLKSKPFGLASWSTTAALRKIQLRKLTADEAAPVKPDEKAKE